MVQIRVMEDLARLSVSSRNGRVAKGGAFAGMGLGISLTVEYGSITSKHATVRTWCLLKPGGMAHPY